MHHTWFGRLFLVLALFAAGGAAAATAAEEVTLSVSIKDHRFEPSEIRAPANTPLILIVKNLDPTPEEFESKALRIEKIVGGKSEITLRIRPLGAGRYQFFGEFHEDTAQGHLAVE